MAHLIALLDDAGYAPATQRQYGGYLRHFVRWCAARGRTDWPVPPDLIAAYIRELGPEHRGRMRALEAAHRAAGLGSLSEHQLVEDALVMQGLTPQRSKSVGLRDAQYLNLQTRQTYQRRIRAFERWCARSKIEPAWSAVDPWLDTRPLSASARYQYKAAIRHWEAIEPPAPAQTPPPEPEASTAVTPPTRQAPRRPLTLRTPEQRLLYQLGRTGVAEHHRHARGFAKVTDRRLRALVRSGYVQVHVGVVRPHDERSRPHTVRYYSLGGRGRRWLKSRSPGHLYRWNPQQLNHDLHLTDVYCQLPPEVQRTWQCESELIEQLRSAGRFTAGEAVDAAVVIDGQPYAIEIAIGYKRADLESKRAFIRDAFDGRGMLVH